MYRLLCGSNISSSNVKILSRQISKNFEIASSSGHCPLVRNTLNFKPLSVTNNGNNMPTSNRSQSTSSTQMELLKKAKKIRKNRYTKFVELLEVTNMSSKQTKTKVKRLHAKKLSDFVTKTQHQILTKWAKEEEKNKKAKENLEKSCNLSKRKKSNKQHDSLANDTLYQPIEYQKYNLDLLENSLLESGMYDDKPMIFFAKENVNLKDQAEIDNIMKSFKAFRDYIENFEHEEVEENDLSVGVDENITCKPVPVETLDNIEDDVIKELEKREAPQPENNHRFKSKFHQSANHEKLAKQKALRMTLTTYLHVCVSVGLANRGLSTILTYRHRSKKHHQISDIINVELYNILLHGYAGNGNYDKIKEILALMAEDGIANNHQTFAGIFECLGRLEPTNDNLQLIQKYINKVNDFNITLDSIFDKSIFQSDQREFALDAIQRIKPNFEPIYTPPTLTYSNPLVNSLNATVKNANDVTQCNYGCEIMASKSGFTKEKLQDLARQQLKIELDGSVTIKSIEKTKSFSNPEHCRERLNELQTIWRSQICSAINRDMNTLRAQSRFKPQGYMTYYTYLKCLEPSQYANILLKEIRMLAEGSETYSPTVGQLYRNLGQKVQAGYLIEQKKKNGVLEKIGDIYSDYCVQWENCNSSDNPRQMWQRLVHNSRTTGPSMDIQELTWPNNVLIGVGRFLYNILMRDIKIDMHILRTKSKIKNANLVPAFYTLFRNQGRIVKEEVKPHPVLARLLRASSQQTLTFDSHLVPMLCPPQPWSTPVNGGYLLTKVELIRLPHQAVQQSARINDAYPADLYPSLDSLNQLASVPWNVNTDILDIIIEVFQNGGNSKLDVPQPPSSLPSLPQIPKKDFSISNVERAKLFKEKMSIRRKQAEMYSLWCDTLYRLSLANHYRDKVFWLPHNMDFRGRVYPVPPHLNHLGSDLARSLLVFHQKRPLGPDGFSWLKLHCINLTGLKKRESVSDRLLYFESILDDILDSADKPLTGKKWWATSDEPWQTLACCIEIAKVHRSGDPENYMSNFPIHQDGSCNGLQHYAALGRDLAGAISVNLSPSDIPGDVYSSVASLVEKTRKGDAANGLKVAVILDGFVQRKVIKQTVMTTVYGVTRYGARLQIARQLKDIDNFPREWVWAASSYLTTKTFESLREMFTSTREIQDWFTECARLISSVCAQNVEWRTPLGLPVVQPYNRSDVKYVPKNNLRVSETMSMDMYEKPNVMKQKNAFPPNFIHSLDSSHMMLTSLHCERRGLTFISVHDCFWTHACTVPDMNKICREQFVALHSLPILEDLSKFMIEKYSFDKREIRNDGSIHELTKRKLNRVLQQVPTKGSFDLRSVLDSVYFFS